MTKFEVGDKVRIVYEGTVKRVGDFDFDIDTVHGIRYFTPSEPEVRDADLVERRKPKVGDILKGKEAFDSLPEGAVIELGYGPGYAIADGKGNLHLSNGDTWLRGQTFSQRKLVYLPD